MGKKFKFYRFCVSLFFSALISFGVLSHATLKNGCEAAFGDENTFNAAELSKCLQEGVILETHGVVPEQKLALGTLRSTKNFFRFQHLSVLGTTPEIREQILKLNRHDLILVRGEVVESHAPQIHIRVFELKVEKKSDSGEKLDAYPYDVKIPDDLAGQKSMVALVHAVFDEGRILVVEYKDVVLPVFVEEKYTFLTRDLFRNDLIEFFFTIQNKPGRPVHLNIIDPSDTDKKSLAVLDSMIKHHSEKVTFEGELAMFPQSPMVMFNVFALRKELDFGLRRYYTLINFEDSNMFKQMREMFQKVWDTQVAFQVNDRNKWRNPKIRIEVSGFLNVQDPNQANVQIIVDKLSDIKITVIE